MSRHTWAASLSTAVVAVVVGEALLLQGAHPTTATHDWEISLAVLGAVMILLVVGLLTGTRRERPRLFIGNPVMEDVSLLVPDPNPAVLTTSASAAITPMTQSETFKVAYLNVRNQPKQGNQRAEAVHVRLRYLRDGKCLYDLPGRWSFTDQTRGFESTQRPDQETLEANGVDNKFDVAAKFYDQDQCHAINDRSRYIGWQEFPLGHDPVTVEVIAQGSNVKATVSRWTLSHDGLEGSLQLDRLDAPGRLGRLALRLAGRVERRWS